MPKKKSDITPNSKIKNMLRRGWLQSRERSTALKRDKYTCQKCGIKQSRKKHNEVYVEVHHKHQKINWDDIIEILREKLFCTPDLLITLCERCHKEEGNQYGTLRHIL